MVYGRVDIAYLKKSGFEHFLAQDLSFPESNVSIVNKAETRATYMVLTSHYLALSDERKKGLVRLAIQEQNGAVIKGLEEARQDMDTQFFEPGHIPPHFPDRVDKVLENSLDYLKEAVYLELEDFQKSMQRRLQRDVRNLREYYAALAREMRQSLERPSLSQAQREERQAKLDALPLEEERKIEDQQHKYNTNVTIRPAAVLRILLDVVKVELHIRHRKWQKTQHIVYNPLTRRFDPLTCQRCGKSIRFIYPQAVRDNLQLLCYACNTKR